MFNVFKEQETIITTDERFVKSSSDDK